MYLPQVVLYTEYIWMLVEAPLNRANKISIDSVTSWSTAVYRQATTPVL
jgi:hypothetical protein